MLNNKLLSLARARINAYMSATIGASEAMGRHLDRVRGLLRVRPFNGQVNRAAIFRAVLDVCAISIIVETGTRRGATTEYMGRNFTGKIYSCDVDPRYFEYAKRRLEHFTNVELQLIDSRQLLEQVFNLPLPQDKPNFFYLDAHWNEDLPLLGEISLILNSNVPAVIMIDDFEVPFDQGYGYYTHGKRKLCLEMLNGFRDQLRYAYFPALPAETETGPRRGCIVFTNSVELDQRLRTLPSLTRVTQNDWSFYGL